MPAFHPYGLRRPTPPQPLPLPPPLSISARFPPLLCRRVRRRSRRRRRTTRASATCVRRRARRPRRPARHARKCRPLRSGRRRRRRRGRCGRGAGGTGRILLRFRATKATLPRLAAGTGGGGSRRGLRRRRRWGRRCGWTRAAARRRESKKLRTRSQLRVARPRSHRYCSDARGGLAERSWARPVLGESRAGRCTRRHRSLRSWYARCGLPGPCCRAAVSQSSREAANRMRAVESEAPGLSSQSDGDTTSSSESPRRASCFEIFEINKGYCDRIFGSKILEGLRAPAPAVMPGVDGLVDSPSQRGAPLGLRVTDRSWTRPVLTTSALQRTSGTRTLRRAPVRARIRRRGGSAGIPAGRRPAEGCAERDGPAAPASARSSWSPPGLAGSPRRAGRFESFETNKCHCDRIFRKKISEGLRRNLGPRPCGLSTAPGNPGAFPVASRARRGGPLGRHGTGRRMPDPGRRLPRGGPPPWRPPAAPPI